MCSPADGGLSLAAVDNTDSLCGHEARLARIEAMIAAFNQRLDEAILTQLKDHGKRIRELEDNLHELQRLQAIEAGRHQGGKAMLSILLSVAGTLGGIAGTLIMRVFNG